jgi:hypothetical protein
MSVGVAERRVVVDHKLCFTAVWRRDEISPDGPGWAGWAGGGGGGRCIWCAHTSRVVSRYKMFPVAP